MTSQIPREHSSTHEDIIVEILCHSKPSKELYQNTH
uniref:Uncharacterized protein n=1 Tax=Rhizophora mucronata TaxID=61149 RepID=A0A2P2R035_RHIMU